VTCATSELFDNFVSGDQREWVGDGSDGSAGKSGTLLEFVERGEEDDGHESVGHGGAEFVGPAPGVGLADESAEDGEVDQFVKKIKAAGHEKARAGIFYVNFDTE
jgi:hypothetical protein